MRTYEERCRINAWSEINRLMDWDAFMSLPAGTGAYFAKRFDRFIAYHLGKSKDMMTPVNATEKARRFIMRYNRIVKPEAFAVA